MLQRASSAITMLLCVLVRTCSSNQPLTLIGRTCVRHFYLTSWNMKETSFKETVSTLPTTYVRVEAKDGGGVKAMCTPYVEMSFPDIFDTGG